MREQATLFQRSASMKVYRAAKCGRGSIVSLTALLALVVLSACNGNPTGTASVRATATASPKPLGPKPASIQGQVQWYSARAVGAVAQSVTAQYQANSADANVTIMLTWNAAWRDHFAEAQSVAETACYNAQAALWTSGLALSSVTVTTLGATVDDYADPIVAAYAACVLSAASAKNFAWGALSPAQAWAKYDVVFLRPTYAPNWVYLSASERGTPTVTPPSH
jgi:hypothetical protein